MTLNWTAVRGLAMYFVAWTPLVLAYALLVGARQGLPAALAIAVAVQTIAIAAILGLGVRRLAQRFAPHASGRLGWALQHAVFAVSYAALWNGGILLGIRQDTGSWSTVWQSASSWFWWQMLNGVIVYALLVAWTWTRLSTQRVASLDRARLEAEALRVQAELDALRGRLNPHFLFNTLHSITALARQDSARTEEALTTLADLLRYVLDPVRGGREHVRLGDELTLVERYLALERLRFGSRLQVSWQVDDETLEATVPSLVLQPLVENAVKHAVAPRASGGTVQVRTEFSGDTLVVEVTDDGDTAGHDSSGTGIGLPSLRQRLALLYGDRASLVTRHLPTGFQVALRLPA
ncbi:MAG: histidine kinase [Gemmatimonadaceae bacterium]|nr:histidine kinase [Gemmatimonadaceae bacterium]